MAILPFPFGALNTALSLLIMHGISVTMFRSFLNQTLPSMEANSKGDKYQITLTKPSAKISNFLPEEIRFIQKQLNNRNRNSLDLQNISSLSSNSQIPNLSLSNLPSQTTLQSTTSNLSPSNPIGVSSNIMQQFSQFRQQPFTGTISLHNHGKSTLSDLTNQVNSNRITNQYSQSYPTSTTNLVNDNQMNTQSQHISSLNLPFSTAGLNPNQAKIVHIHHHDTQSDAHHQPSSPINLNNDQIYQNLNTFESSIKPGSVISFQSVLSKRQGSTGSVAEPVIKELSLNKITKFLERKRKKEKMKTQKSNSIRIVCSYVFDVFAKETLDPKLIGDASFCTHLNIHSLVIKSNYQVGFNNQYQETERLNELMKIKNQNKNLKFILTIGDISDIQTYDKLCSSAQLTTQFIDSITNIIQLYEFDGVNFNLKFDLNEPDVNLSFLFKQNLMQMLRQFRDELNRIGRPSFIVSALLPNSPEVIKLYFDLKELNDLLDFVNVIGYEFHEYKKENSVATHHSALYASKDDNLDWLIKNWLNTDLERNKLNIGLSTFGRTYNVAYNKLRSLDAPLIGLGINNGTINYGDVCKFLLKNETTYIFNEKYQVPFAYNGYDLIAFENEKSISVKTKYISKSKIGGIMIFALNYDDIYGDCDNMNSEINKFPLHRAAFKTMELASFVVSNKKLR